MNITLFIIAVSGLLCLYGQAAPQEDPKQDSASYQIRIVEPQAVPGSAAPPDSAAPPVLQKVEWHSRDTALHIAVLFNRVPERYLAYPMEDKDRIVLDCHGTGLAPGVTLEGAKAPVQSATVKELTLKSNIKLTRLVFYTKTALAFHVEEGPSSLVLYISWEIERPKAGPKPAPKQAAVKKVAKVKSKRILYASLGAAAIAGVVVGYLVSRSSSDGGNGDEEIPYIDVPTPDGQ